jgi:hypothetical protein
MALYIEQRRWWATVVRCVSVTKKGWGGETGLINYNGGRVGVLALEDAHRLASAVAVSWCWAKS